MDLRWGVDLGGTKIECAVLEDGKAVVRRRVPTEADRGYRHILGQIAKALGEAAAEVGQKPLAVGVGTPGSVDPRTGFVRNANTTALIGRSLPDDLQAKLGIAVRVANDANCFALAEATLGAAKGYRSVFGVIMGTGVGGGIVIDGKPLDGASGIAGEWGHNLLEPGGEPCYCGKIGCVETVLSGPFLERWHEKQTGETKRLKAIAEEGGATIDRLCEKFGEGLSVVVNILDPDAIVLGGGVSNVDRLYSDGAAALKRYVFHDDYHPVVLRPLLGDSAGVFGAAML